MVKFNPRHPSRNRETASALSQAAVGNTAPVDALVAAAQGTQRRAVTHEGGPGRTRHATGQLMLLAVQFFVGERVFYAQPDTRVARLQHLIAEAAREDPQWLIDFLPVLRFKMFMRTVTIMATAMYCREVVERGAQLPPGAKLRNIVDSVMGRADEPAEFFAYWEQLTGRRLQHSGMRRGLVQAMLRLYNERSAIKYDGTEAQVRMGDLVEIMHPTKDEPWRGQLWSYLLDRRHNPQAVRADLNQLPTIDSWRRLQSIDPDIRAATMAHWAREGVLEERLRRAGVTWEFLSGWIGRPLTRDEWAALAPSMGYMALIRNLRNMDQAGLDDIAAAKIARRIADPDEVARSRQLPMRFVTAHRNVPSLRWGQALSTALDLSLANVPAYPGRTLVLVDVSRSMTQNKLSAKSDLRSVDVAALFGVALAKAAFHADLYVFDMAGRELQGYGRAYQRSGDALWQGDPLRWPGYAQWPLTAGAPVLREMDKLAALATGGGTDVPNALRNTFRPGYHDRVFLLSDMQTAGDTRIGSLVPADVPLYGFNFNGYDTGVINTSKPNRYEIGGFSDAMFSALPLLEAGPDEVSRLDMAEEEDD